MITYGQVKDATHLFDPYQLDDLALAIIANYPTLPAAVIGDPDATWEDVEGELMIDLKRHYYDHYLLYPEDDLSLRASSALYLNAQRVNNLINSTLYEYNPIENYRMTETEAETSSSDEQGSGVSSGNTFAKEYPFDATGAKPVSSSDTGANSSSSLEREGQRDRTLTRSGNIGVTTSQQMIQSERDIAASAIGWIMEILNPFFFLDDNDL